MVLMAMIDTLYLTWNCRIRTKAFKRLVGDISKIGTFTWVLKKSLEFEIKEFNTSSSMSVSYA